MNVPSPKETFVHTRSGKQFVIEHLARDGATGNPVVTYTGVDSGVTWTRPLDDFMGWDDGAPRFELMATAQEPEEPVKKGTITMTEDGATEIRDANGTLRVRFEGDLMRLNTRESDESQVAPSEAVQEPVRSQGQQITELIGSARLMHLEAKVSGLEARLDTVQSALSGVMAYCKETDAAVQESHWNSPQSLPPVGCSLVIKLPKGEYPYGGAEEGMVKLCVTLEEGVEVTATRACHVQQRGNDLTYLIQCADFPDFTVKGQFAWTYP